MLKVAVVTNYFPISTHPWNGHSAYQTLRLLAQTCDVHVFYPEADEARCTAALVLDVDPIALVAAQGILV